MVRAGRSSVRSTRWLADPTPITANPQATKLMVAQNKDNPEPKQPLKLVKALPSSPIHAVFDIIELEGKQVVVCSLGFTDQFGMDRMNKSASMAQILGIGQRVMDIFEGKIDITEPSEEDQKRLLELRAKEQKEEVVNAYQKKESNEPIQGTD